MSADYFVSVGPHDFEPLRRFRNNGRCRACLCSERSHPTKGWTKARALGDKRTPIIDIRYSPTTEGPKEL